MRLSCCAFGHLLLQLPLLALVLQQQWQTALHCGHHHLL
jgi:hypothetical protein